MSPGISPAIIDEIEVFSEFQLNKKVDLKTLYDLSAKNSKEKLFDDLIFTAKYVQGLLRVLKTGAGNPEVKSLEHIKKDFTHNMQKVVDQMKLIVVDAEEEIKRYFEVTYFDLSQKGIQNLSLILSDLEWTKKYLNVRKRLEID